MRCAPTRTGNARGACRRGRGDPRADPATGACGGARYGAANRAGRETIGQKRQRGPQAPKIGSKGTLNEASANHLSISRSTLDGSRLASDAIHSTPGPVAPLASAAAA
eukprot:815336-Pyramimonas_sp.AAC.1